MHLQNDFGFCAGSLVMVPFLEVVMNQHLSTFEQKYIYIFFSVSGTLDPIVHGFYENPTSLVATYLLKSYNTFLWPKTFKQLAATKTNGYLLRLVLF